MKSEVPAGPVEADDCWNVGDPTFRVDLEDTQVVLKKVWCAGWDVFGDHD
ncbi:hypothetical protein AB3N59_05605 [Leptospira sp. WS92.C1]